MLTLNLVYKDKSDIPYEVITFSDSQVQFKLLLNDPFELKKEDIQICSRFSWSDLQIIIAAVAALREAYVEDIMLDIPYFLGARSDRKFVSGGCNYVKDVVAPIINSLDLNGVYVMDPHSDVVEACIKYLDKEDNLDLVKFALEDLYPYNSQVENLPGNFVLVSPDAGALKKIYHVAEELANYYAAYPEIIVASKHRDVKTGKILSTEVPLPPHITLQAHTKDFIIVDDICDGGRTFIEIAKVIKEKLPSAKIYLIVTHGIFSAGLKELQKYFERIYCTNSVKDIDEKYLMDQCVNCGMLFEPVREGFVKQLNIF